MFTIRLIDVRCINFSKTCSSNQQDMRAEERDHDKLNKSIYLIEMKLREWGTNVESNVI